MSWIVDFAIPMDHRGKIRENKERQILWPCQGNKKAMEFEVDGDSNCNWYVWNNPQRLGKRAGGVRNQWTSQDHPKYSIVKINQNTEKSPGDLRRLAVTQTPI